MAIARVQTNNLRVLQVTSADIVFDNDITSGNSIVTCHGHDQTSTTVTDNQGNTYTLDQRINATRMAEMNHSSNVAPGTTTVTFEANVTADFDICIIEYDKNIEVDVADQASQSTGTSHPCGSITTTVNDTVIVATSRNYNVYSATPATGFSQLAKLDRAFFQERIPTDIETADADWTSASDSDVSSVIVAYKEISSGVNSISGISDLFIDGNEFISTSGDLIILGNQEVSNDTDLYINGLDITSDSKDLFIQGIITTSGSSNLVIFTKDAVQTSGDLFITGVIDSSGNIDYFIKGKDTESNTSDLFIEGFSSGFISNSADLFLIGIDNTNTSEDLYIQGLDITTLSTTLFIAGLNLISDNVELLILSNDSVSGSNDLLIPGKDSSQFSGDLLVFGNDIVSFSGNMYIGGPIALHSQINLFIFGSSDVVAIDSSFDLFINGIEPKSVLVCPILDVTASIQIKNSLIRIYQSRIDALINQLGKNVQLEFEPIRTSCPNCTFDNIRKRSTGIYIPGGPRPFTRGRKCPWCKGRGYEETTVTKCIKCLVKWNPEDVENFGISIGQKNGIVRFKTFLTEADDLIHAKTAIANRDIEDQLKLRVRLIKGPIPVGLRESRYCISFWELM